jgi:hypothetical protein
MNLKINFIPCVIPCVYEIKFAILWKNVLKSAVLIFCAIYVYVLDINSPNLTFNLSCNFTEISDNIFNRVFCFFGGLKYKWIILKHYAFVIVKCYSIIRN